MDTGKLIKQLRISHNLTQSELGRKLGVQKSAIAKYESGRVENLKKSTIQALSDIFDISPLVILGLENIEYNNNNDEDSFRQPDVKKKLKLIFSKNLQKYLHENNKSQVDLCNELGFTSSTVSDWIQGKKYPRMDKIQAMADYFRIKKSDLIDDISETKIEEGMISNINDAILLLLSNPIVSAYSGYDFECMSDEEKLQFVNKIIGVLKPVIKKRK